MIAIHCLGAILAVAGDPRLMGANDEITPRRLKALHGNLINPAITEPANREHRDLYQSGCGW